MATNNGTTFRTDFTADDSKFSTVLNRVKGKTRDYGTEVKKSGAVTADATKKQQQHGRAMLEVSRAYDDLQYGIRGVLNNIPGILEGLGATAKMTGILTIAVITAEALWRKFGKSSGDAADKVDKWKDVSSRFQDYAAAIKDAIDGMAEAWDGYQEHLDDSASAAEKIAKVQHERRAMMLDEQALLVDQRRLAGELTDEQAKKLKLDIESAKALNDLAEARREDAAAIELQNAKTAARRDDLAGLDEQGRGLASEVSSLTDTREQSRRRLSRTGARSAKKQLEDDTKALELKKVELEQNDKARKAAQKKLEAEERALAELTAGNDELQKLRVEQVELKTKQNDIEKAAVEKEAADKEAQRQIYEFTRSGKSDRTSLRMPRNLTQPARAPNMSLIDGAAPRSQFSGLDKLAELQKQTLDVQSKSLEKLSTITKEL